MKKRLEEEQHKTEKNNVEGGGSTAKNKSDNGKKEIKMKVHLMSLVKKKKLIPKLIWCLKSNSYSRTQLQGVTLSTNMCVKAHSMSRVETGPRHSIQIVEEHLGAINLISKQLLTSEIFQSNP